MQDDSGLGFDTKEQRKKEFKEKLKSKITAKKEDPKKDLEYRTKKVEAESDDEVQEVKNPAETGENKTQATGSM